MNKIKIGEIIKIENQDYVIIKSKVFVKNEIGRTTPKLILLNKFIKNMQRKKTREYKTFKILKATINLKKNAKEELKK